MTDQRKSESPDFRLLNPKNTYLVKGFNDMASSLKVLRRPVNNKTVKLKWSQIKELRYPGTIGAWCKMKGTLTAEYFRKEIYYGRVERYPLDEKEVEDICKSYKGKFYVRGWSKKGYEEMLTKK